MDYLAAWMFLALTILLMAGFPVTFTLLGVALTFGMIGFGWDFFNLLPLRIWGRMTNVTLAAVPQVVWGLLTLILLLKSPARFRAVNRPRSECRG